MQEIEKRAEEKLSSCSKRNTSLKKAGGTALFFVFHPSFCLKVSLSLSLVFFSCFFLLCSHPQLLLYGARLWHWTSEMAFLFFWSPHALFKSNDFVQLSAIVLYLTSVLSKSSLSTAEWSLELALQEFLSVNITGGLPWLATSVHAKKGRLWRKFTWQISNAHTKYSKKKEPLNP